MEILSKVFTHPHCIVFRCECVCENCGHKETLYGYDNEEFYSTILNKWESHKYKSYQEAREQAILKVIELCQKEK